MKSNLFNKFFDALPKIQLIFAIIGSLFIFGFAIFNGISSGFGLFVSILVGLVGAGVVLGAYSLMGIWTIANDSLTAFMTNHPKLRRATIIFSSIAILIGSYIFVVYVKVDILLKVGVGILFLLLVPSALTSIIFEERRRESFKLLGHVITPELISQCPQAAVEFAFTNFEDHLRNRLGVGSEVFSERLINMAYGQDGKLKFSDVESENIGVRNLFSGVYATFRNPRKHRVVNDDKESALAIIALVELLIQIINKSSEK